MLQENLAVVNSDVMTRTKGGQTLNTYCDTGGFASKTQSYLLSGDFLPYFGGFVYICVNIMSFDGDRKTSF